MFDISPDCEKHPAKFRKIFRLVKRMFKQSFVECFKISFVCNKAEVKFRSFPAMLWVNICGHVLMATTIKGRVRMATVICIYYKRLRSLITLHFSVSYHAERNNVYTKQNTIASWKLSLTRKYILGTKEWRFKCELSECCENRKQTKTHRTIENRARSGRPRKLNEAARTFIGEQMQANDETISCQIQKRFQKRGFTVHASTVRRSHKERGCTLQNTRYCQIIREASKAKRLEYAQRVIDIGDTFHNVVFSDECSISLQQFRRTCYRKIDERGKRKPKPKHPLKVHDWAGISRHYAKTGKNKKKTLL